MTDALTASAVRCLQAWRSSRHLSVDRTFVEPCHPSHYAPSCRSEGRFQCARSGVAILAASGMTARRSTTCAQSQTCRVNCRNYASRLSPPRRSIPTSGREVGSWGSVRRSCSIGAEFRFEGGHSALRVGEVSPRPDFAEGMTTPRIRRHPDQGRRRGWTVPIRAPRTPKSLVTEREGNRSR